MEVQGQRRRNQRRFAGVSIALLALFAAVPAFAAAPANDNFANATFLPTQPPINAVGTTVDATSETGEPAGSGPATVWYQWEAPGRSVNAGVCVESDADIGVAIYSVDPADYLFDPSGLPAPRQNHDISEGSPYGDYAKLECPGDPSAAIAFPITISPRSDITFQVSGAEAPFVLHVFDADAAAICADYREGLENSLKKLKKARRKLKRAKAADAPAGEIKKLKKKVRDWEDDVAYWKKRKAEACSRA